MNSRSRARGPPPLLPSAAPAASNEAAEGSDGRKPPAPTAATASAASLAAGRAVAGFAPVIGSSGAAAAATTLVSDVQARTGGRRISSPCGLFVASCESASARSTSAAAVSPGTKPGIETGATMALAKCVTPSRAASHSSGSSQGRPEDVEDTERCRRRVAGGGAGAAALLLWLPPAIAESFSASATWRLSVYFSKRLRKGSGVRLTAESGVWTMMRKSWSTAQRRE